MTGYRDGQRKPAFKARLSKDGIAILERLADKLGIPKNAVVELALRELDLGRFGTASPRQSTKW
jgi:hypothetical protein